MPWVISTHQMHLILLISNRELILIQVNGFPENRVHRCKIVVLEELQKTVKISLKIKNSWKKSHIMRAKSLTMSVADLSGKKICSLKYQIPQKRTLYILLQLVQTEQLSQHFFKVMEMSVLLGKVKMFKHKKRGTSMI